MNMQKKTYPRMRVDKPLMQKYRKTTIKKQKINMCVYVFWMVGKVMSLWAYLQGQKNT